MPQGQLEVLRPVATGAGCSQQPGLELWLHPSAPDADAGRGCTEIHWADGSLWVNECTLHTTAGS